MTAGKQDLDIWKMKVKCLTLGGSVFFVCLFLTVYLFCPHCKDEQETVMQTVEKLTDNVVDRILG